MSVPDPQDPGTAHPTGTLPSGKPEAFAPGLWIVATPIGNLGDLSARAAGVLQAADLVACEDTRRTGRMLKAFGLRAKLTSYHDHSPAGVRADLVRRLGEGALVALVSDAGTPLVSDPGYKLVREAVEAGIMVTCAPGPSSPLAALVVSGLPSDRFLVAGYPPARPGARRDFLAEFADLRATLIFLESPRRLASALRDMRKVFGERRAAVARELTKLHEEIRRGDLSALAEEYAGGPPKGEVVIVVEGRAPKAVSDAEVEALLDEALSIQSVRDAAADVAAATGRPRTDVYARALRLKRGAPRQ